VPWATLALTVIIAASVTIIALTIAFFATRSIRGQPAPGTSSTPIAALSSQVPTGVSVTPVPELVPTVAPTPVPPSPTPTPQPFLEGPIAYGHSFNELPLLAYRLGTGPSARAIIGGIHGGYEWNTVELVSQTLQYLQDNPALIPDQVTLYIIPCANPDGYAAGHSVELGRVNGNGVDLNRNWDYDHQITATHGTRPVDAGTSPFSEPETAALRDLILDQRVEAAIFYHSAMARIFYGAERDRSATYELALVISEATGYPIAEGVPGQITTGDAIDWMSARGLAGIEVELTTHEDIEWERNRQGLLAFLNWMPPRSPLPVVQSAQIGTSVQGRPIAVTQVGSGGQVALVIVGDIHGDETNTQVLVRSLMEQYASAPESVPPPFTLYFVPTMNPDGLSASTRTNANGVDLNRNWPTDDWKADAARTNGIVPGSGGSGPGSEPEVQAVARWLLDTVKPVAQEVWLLSYHSAYPPAGGVQPGYTTYGTPGAQSDWLAGRVAELSGYTYLPTWPSEYQFTGELIHWCDINGIWAAEVELPSYDMPDTALSGGSETTLATQQRVLRTLLMASEVDSDRLPPAKGGYWEYRVQPGETLLGIAIRFNVEMEDIIRPSGISDDDFVTEGELLLIPVAGDEQP